MVKQRAPQREEQAQQAASALDEEGAELEDLLGNGFLLEQGLAGEPEDGGVGLGGLLGVVAAQAEASLGSAHPAQWVDGPQGEALEEAGGLEATASSGALVELGSSLVGGAANMLEAGAELVGQGLEQVVAGFQSAGELLEWLDSVDEVVARRALDLAARVSEELVEALIIQAPQHPLAGFALTRLSESGTGRVLGQLDPAAMALLIASVPVAAISLLCPALAGLPPALLAAALVRLHAERLGPLLEGLAQAGLEALSWAIANLVPTDVGVGFAADVAATFGMPIKAGGQGGFQVIYRGGAEFDIRAYGHVVCAGDTGVEAGGSTSVGGADLEDGQLGVGIGGEASAEAGLRQVWEAEYGIDLLALRSPAEVFRLVGEAADRRALADMVTRLALGMGIASFHRKSSYRYEVYGEAGFGGDVGVRTGNAETVPFFDAPDSGNNGEVASWWQHFLQLYGSIQVSASAGVELSIETKEWADEGGVRAPVDPQFKVKGSAEGLLEVQQGTPFLSMPAFPDVGGGCEYEVSFPLRGDEERCAILDPTFRATGKASVNGSEASVSLGLESFNSSDPSYEAVLDNLRDMALEWKVGLGAPLVEEVVKSALTEAGLRGNGLLKAEGGVTLKSVVKGDALREVLRTLAGDADRDANAYWVLLQTVHEALQSGGKSIGPAWEEVVRAVHAGQEQSKLHAEVTLRLQGQAGVAAGAKVKAEGGGEVTAILDKELGQELDEQQVQALLSGDGQQGGDAWEESG